MSETLDSKLEYRDYVVHVFSGILFDVFLLTAIWPTLPLHWWEHELHNAVVWSIIAIPVLFLEGHFILAIDRFFFIEFPSWCFGLKKQKKNNDGTVEKPSDDDDQESAPYREAREIMYQKCKTLFYLLFGKRIIGQKIIRKKNVGPLVKIKNRDKENRARRYYVMSDFFKGVGFSAWTSIIVAFALQNWHAVVILGLVIVLAWLRCRFYSRLYVKSSYKKKCNGKEEAIENKINIVAKETE